MYIPPPSKEKLNYHFYLDHIEEHQETGRATYRLLMRNVIQYHQYELIRIRRTEEARRYLDQQRREYFIAELEERDRLQYLFYQRGPDDEFWALKLELKENRLFIRDNPYDHRDIFLDDYRLLIEKNKRTRGLRQSETEPLPEERAPFQPNVLLPMKFHAAAESAQGIATIDPMSTAINMPMIAALYLQTQALAMKPQLHPHHRVRGLSEGQMSHFLNLNLRK